MDAMSYLMKSEFRKESQFRFHGESYMGMCAEVIMNRSQNYKSVQEYSNNSWKKVNVSARVKSSTEAWGSGVPSWKQHEKYEVKETQRKS